jgi:hypothetical protein
LAIAGTVWIFRCFSLSCLPARLYGKFANLQFAQCT